VVRTAAPDSLKKALVGAWYETLALLTASGTQTDAALLWMAQSSGATVDEFKAQLATTAMYYTGAEGAAFAASPEVGATMDKVRQFTFSKGLLGPNAASADVVGIELNDGSVLGNKDNIKLRFTASYMQQAADGTL
jgi:NitT/TauT family transport system substrate-binding protein